MVGIPMHINVMDADDAHDRLLGCVLGSNTPARKKAF